MDMVRERFKHIASWTASVYLFDFGSDSAHSMMEAVAMQAVVISIHLKVSRCGAALRTALWPSTA